MRVALVHDWLTGMRGGEKVFEQLCLLYPGADVHTLLYDPARVSPAIRAHPVTFSFVQSLPLARRWYRWYLPLFPAAIESFDFGRYDLVVSSSHCCALGALAPARALHVCYCHTPMRYAWDHLRTYVCPTRFGPVMRALITWELRRLRLWDQGAARRVHRFAANSACVARRIAAHYGRESAVVPPPVDTAFYTPAPVPRGDFYLAVAAPVPYKRLDLAVAAFNALKLPLVVIGEGSDRRRLERAAGPTVRFLGWQPDAVVRDHYRRARAFVQTGEEEFGIAALEATACGTPVLAYGSGGALETVREGVNGRLFPEQTADSLAAAVRALARETFDAAAMRAHALRFAPARFREAFARVVGSALRERAVPAAA